MQWFRAWDSGILTSTVAAVLSSSLLAAAREVLTCGNGACRIYGFILCSITAYGSRRAGLLLVCRRPGGAHLPREKRAGV